jgi:fatty acid synthase
LEISFWIVVPTCLITLQLKVKYCERTVYISLEDESMEYLSGHVIDGKNLFPAAGYLVS